ncbi:ABC transporter permease subunit [Anaerobacillus alkaliphilus]|uniref:ABC transporter permease subunit n=1 Tax=Anaerobacillus alkaliphilus TaxID=1548597 RepID=A0A4Q0VTF9_9BACI|nr:ABC transporter permease subunit [Anaerobacillus alkaliphilus]RXJ01103.1 ABC transporter permease subunit [Anaerobacillus alkaliphilus]
MLARKILKSFFMYMVVMMLIVLIVFFPRQLDVTLVEGVMQFDYSFSWINYYENLKQFFTYAFENKSLGVVQGWMTVEQTLGFFLPQSLKVIFAAFVISIFIGIYKGIFDYKQTNRRTSFLGNGTTFMIQAIPDFFLIILTILVVITFFPFIPIFSQGEWYSFIIPSIIVSIYPTLYIARITSTLISNEDGMQYIQVAKAKGLTNRMVLYRHMLRNCYGTILSHCSSVMLLIISNLLMVEYLLGYKGAAYRLFEALSHSTVIVVGQRHNFEGELIIGISFCFLVIVLLSRIISELASSYLDPRRKESI